MNLMHKEVKKYNTPLTKGLSKEILKLLEDVEHFNNEPPPIPVEAQVESKRIIESLTHELETEKLKVAQLLQGIDEIGTIALGYKAEAMAERVENKRFIDGIRNWLPQKVMEALNITIERTEEGRELRVKQCLHALEKPQKLSAN